MRGLVGAALAVVMAAAAGVSEARAGAFGDELTKCIVKASSPRDQADLVIWIFGATSAHPAIKDYSKFSDEQVVAANRRMAALTERLLAVDCREPAVLAMRYEGEGALEGAFAFLGETAMTTLMSDKAVSGRFEAFTAYVDVEKMTALALEAKRRNQ